MVSGQWSVTSPQLSGLGRASFNPVLTAQDAAPRCDPEGARAYDWRGPERQCTGYPSPPFPDSVAKFFYFQGLWRGTCAKYVIPLKIAADFRQQRGYWRTQGMRRFFCRWALGNHSGVHVSIVRREPVILCKVRIISLSEAFCFPAELLLGGWRWSLRSTDLSRTRELGSCFRIADSTGKT